MSIKTRVGVIGMETRVYVFSNIFPFAHHFDTVCTCF
jgi:hypothetical protein